MIIKKFACLLLLCFLTLQTGLAADDTPAHAKDDLNSVKPWGSISLRSLGRTRELLRAVVPQLPWTPLTNMLQRVERVCKMPGVSLDEPLLLFVRFRDNNLANPELTVALPMTDTAEFIRACSAMPPLEVKPAGEGRWLLKRRNVELLVVSNGQRLLITNVPQLLDNPETVLSWFSGLDFNSDIAVRILTKGFPYKEQDAWRDGIFNELLKRKKQAIESSSPNAALAISTVQILESCLKRWENGIRQIDLKLHYENSLRVTMDWVAAPESKFASDISKLPLDEISFEGGHSDSKDSVTSTFEMTLAANIPEPVKALLSLAIDRLQDELSKELGYRPGKEHRSAAEGIFETISTTLNAGRLESHLAFVPVADRRLVLYGAIAGKNATLLRKSLKTVLPFTAQSNEIRSLQMEAVNNGRLLAHQVTLSKQRPDDKLLYGPDSSLYMGTSSNAFVFAVGGNDAVHVLERLVAVTERTPPLVSVQCRLRPWFILYEQATKQENEFLRSLIATLSETAPQDRLEFQVSALQDGVRLELTVERGLLEMAAVLAKKQLEKHSK